VNTQVLAATGNIEQALADLETELSTLVNGEIDATRDEIQARVSNYLCKLIFCCKSKLEFFNK